MSALPAPQIFDAPIPPLAQLFQSLPADRLWDARSVPRATLDELHAVVSLCPASAPQAPASVLFIASDAGKSRLLPFAEPRRRAAVIRAPICAVVAYDPEFAAHLACAAPEIDPAAVRQVSRRVEALQGAYLVVSARALGLEAAVLDGLDLDGVSREFFASQRLRATCVCALGYPADALI